MIPRSPFQALAPYLSFAALMTLAISIGLGHPRAAQSKAVVDPAKLAEGDKLFHARCGYCHLAGGTGTIMLGRRLFFDTRLSGDGTLSCGSCHLFDYGGAEPRRTSLGIGRL